MTFNIRAVGLDAGANAWSQRRGAVARAIRAHAPDALGLQECMRVQAQEVGEDLPEYDVFGVRPEQPRIMRPNPVFIRREAIEQLEWGELWLSDRPDETGSRTWSEELFPRNVVWGRLRHRASGARFVLANTHLSSMSDDVRFRSARLIVERLPAIAAGDPVVLVGDLNSVPESRAYRLLTGEAIGDATPGALRDLYGHILVREANAGAGAPRPPSRARGTINGFRGERPWRIDHVLGSEGIAARDALIVTDQEGEHYPSDHFPVWVDLELPAPPAAPAGSPPPERSRRRLY